MLKELPPRVTRLDLGTFRYEFIGFLRALNSSLGSSRFAMYGGERPCSAFHVRSRILKSILAFTGSQ